MRTEGKTIDINIIAGILSTIFLVVEIIGVLMVISSGSSIGALDFLIIFGFFYVTYRTLIRKDKLRLWEWVAFIVLTIVNIILIIIGLIIGVVEAYEVTNNYVRLSLWYRIFKG